MILIVYKIYIFSPKKSGTLVINIRNILNIAVLKCCLKSPNISVTGNELTVKPLRWLDYVKIHGNIIFLGFFYLSLYHQPN
jgi:hypothetical protein